MEDNAKSKREEILDAAYHFFLRKGFEKTSMRQIAAQVDVSLGLVSYHFKNKSEMAVELVRRKFEQLRGVAQTYVDDRENPVLYSALLVCLNYTVFSSPRFYHFYRDALRADIILEVLADGNVDTDLAIRAKYFPELDEDTAKRIGLYGNYISASMERTLVLFGEAKALLQEPIPDSVFKSYINLWHLPDGEAFVEECCKKSKALVDKIIYEHPELYE